MRFRSALRLLESKVASAYPSRQAAFFFSMSQLLGRTLQDQTKVYWPIRRETLGTTLKTFISKPLSSRSTQS